MGRFILCTSKQAKNPYTFPISGTKVYSIEELCYYIYNNIYEITPECFDEDMISWLKDELGMQVIAEKLSTMHDNNNSLKDIVISIMCCCDYYTEADIKSLLGVVAKIENMNYCQKYKLKADYLLKYGRYALAKQEYDKLINGGYSVNLTPEEYGKLMHNRSIACFYMGAYNEASEGFKEAYGKNNNPKSLEHYLLSLLLDNKMELFDREALHYGAGIELTQRMVGKLSDAFVKAEDSEEYNKLKNVEKYSEKDEAISYAAGKLETWKNMYREGSLVS